MGGHCKIASDVFMLSQERALLSITRGKFEWVLPKICAFP